MITDYNSLKYYLSQDAHNYPKRTSGLLRRLRNDCGTNPISDQKYIWSYIKTLRYLEYYINKTQRPWDIFFRLYYNAKLKRLSYKTGFQIPPNTIDEGLTIFHWGPIIINAHSHIGKNATLQPLITIGHKQPGGRLSSNW